MEYSFTSNQWDSLSKTAKTIPFKDFENNYHPYGVFVCAPQIINSRELQKHMSDAMLSADDIPASVVQNGNLKAWLKKQGRNEICVYWISTKEPEMVRANMVEPLGAKRTRGGQSTTNIETKKKKSRRNSQFVSTSNHKKPVFILIMS